MRTDAVWGEAPSADELPVAFLPYQQELWRTIDAEPVTVVEKGRRTGYSWALGAVAAAHAATVRSGGGSDVLYMGYEKEMTREFIDYVAMFAKSFQLACNAVEEFVFVDPERPEKSVGAFRIKFASGAEVIALPSVARALRGKQGLVILDEAAFMEDLGEVLKAAFALLIWGGKVVVVSTHNGDTNPFALLVEDIRAGRKPYKLLRLTFDEAIAQGLCRRICAVQGKPWTAEAEADWRDGILAQYGDAADEELHVIPSPSTGTWLPGTLIEARTDPAVPVRRWSCVAGYAMEEEGVRRRTTLGWCADELLPVLERLLPEEPHAFGVDFGRIRDLTVIWVLGIGRDLTRRTRLVVELRNVPFTEQERILFFVADRLPRLRAAKLDARGNGQFLAERAAQKLGESRVEQVMLTEGWYREHMPPLKAALEDDTLTLPRDEEIVGDLRSLKLVRGVARIPERTLNDERQARHGDAAIAAALAFAASRAEPEEYGYEGAPRPLVAAPASGRRWRDRSDEDDPMPGRSRELRGAL